MLIFLPILAPCTWEEWSSWGGCDGTCFGAQGNQVRTRITNPVVSTACVGAASESRPCQCAIDSKGRSSIIYPSNFIYFILSHSVACEFICCLTSYCWPRDIKSLPFSLSIECDNCKIPDGKTDLGYLPDGCDCTKFYQCERNNASSTGWIAYHHNCPPCTVWKQPIVTCDHADFPMPGCPGTFVLIDTQVAHIGGETLI